MEPIGRLGETTHMSYGSLPRNARILDHTASTSASESAQASRLPPSRSRLAKPYVPPQKRGQPQHRCCSAERPPPVYTSHGLRTPTNASVRSEAQKRVMPPSRPSASGVGGGDSVQPPASLAVVTASPAVGADPHMLHGREYTRVRSQSRTRAAAAYNPKAMEPLSTQAPRSMLGSRSNLEDFVYNDDHHRRCSCCRDVAPGAELDEIIWTLNTLKSQIAKLEDRVMAYFRCNDPISPAHQCRYSHQPETSLHARHSSMHPALGSTDSTRRRQVRQRPPMMNPRDEMPSEVRCDCHDPNAPPLRRDYYEMPDSYWMQPEGDYDMDQVEWEEEQDFMGGQAFSQPAEMMSANKLQGQENTFGVGANARCTSAGVALDNKKMVPGDKRVWHLQQARHLLQTLPTSEELTSGVFSDSKRTAKSSGGKQIDETSEIKGSGQASAPRVTTQLSGDGVSSSMVGKAVTTSAAGHLLVKRASGAMERVNTSDCTEVGRRQHHHLSKQNAAVVEVHQLHEGDKKDSVDENSRLLKNALTSNASEKNQSSTTPKSDTSASCFSGYFPVNPIPTSNSKPVCVPALGLGAKALPTSAWLSGESTQGDTYGS